MRTHPRKAAKLGDMIAAVFDQAAKYSTDPEEVARLATSAVTHILRHAKKIPAPSLRTCAGTAC